MFRVIRGRKKDVGRCLAIARSLPSHFTPRALEAMRKDLARCPFWAAKDGSGRIRGFASVSRSTESAAELRWIAVARGSHERGIGTRLVGAVCKWLRTGGFRFLLARTLARESKYEPYEGSRKFFERNGFVHVETLDPFPGWEPGNPCAVYIRAP